MLTKACLRWRYILNVLLCFTRINVQTVLLVLSHVVNDVSYHVQNTTSVKMAGQTSTITQFLVKLDCRP